MSDHQGAQSRLLSTVDPAAQLQWSNLLDLQISQFFAYELQYLLASKNWLTSRRVLDAGCGNGRYLAELRRFFPEKTYVGLDVSHELISTARQNPRLQGIDVILGDFFTYASPEPFGAIVMRLIVQHMKGLPSIFDRLDALLNEDGIALIIEPAPELFRNWPATPSFERLLADYTAATAKSAIVRSELSQLASALEEVNGWSIRSRAQLVAPSVGPFRATALIQIFHLWIDIFERSQAVVGDFSSVRRELDEWASLPTAYNQVGLNIIEVGRRP